MGHYIIVCGSELSKSKVTQEGIVLKLEFSGSFGVTQEVWVEERDVPAANVPIHLLQFDGYRM